MQQAHLSKLFGLIAGTLIAGSGLQAQPTWPIGPITPPIGPRWPIGPITPPIGPIIPPIGPIIPPIGPPSALPSVGILATDPTALGGTSSGAFTVILSETTSNLPVSLAVSGTASNGVDYELITNGVVLATNGITIPAGYLAVDILVQPMSGTPNTGNKTVVLGVTTSTNYQVSPWARCAKVTIVDDIFNIPPPSVEITNPPDGSVFSFPTPITLGASASDSGASISSVSFFANDDFLGKATNSPYSLVWSNAWPGRYCLTALAFDAVGQSTLSAPVHIIVTNSLPVYPGIGSHHGGWGQRPGWW